MVVAERRQQWRVRSFYSLSNILNINKEKDLTFFCLSPANPWGGTKISVRGDELLWRVSFYCVLL